VTSAKEAVFARLDEIGIKYEKYEHEAMFSMDDCSAFDHRIGAMIVKNYFLSTRRTAQPYLCLVRPDAHFNASDISKQAGSSRLSFGSAEMMDKYLRVYPGAVSPLGLIFDTEKKVRLLVDRQLLEAERIAFHPCDNTATVAMRACDFFEKFLAAIGGEYVTVEIHDFAQ